MTDVELRNMTAGAGVLADLFAPITHHLDRVERVMRDELGSRYPFVNELCARVGRYRGKRLRPALVLLAADASGRVNDDHYTLAAVVETVHLATLVHDDVLDDAERRRRQPTINSTHGNVAAVLLGDYLISHAYHLCSSLSDSFASRYIGATTNTVCEGELVEIHHRGDSRISEATYLEIVRGKTASLTATCCSLGARYGGADPDAVTGLREFGLAAGTAFQIVDDILDLIGDQSSTGKSAGLDLAHGSATLPTIHCLAHAEPAIRRQLELSVKGDVEPDRAVVRSWLEETGSIDYAFEAVRGYVDSAIAHLCDLPPTPARDSLQAMAEFIIRRSY